MSEDRQSVDEIELFVFIVQLSRKWIALKIGEGQMLLTPLNQNGIVVRTVYFWPTQGLPLADDAPNATAKVANSIESFEFSAVSFEHVADLLRRDFAGAKKDIGAAVLRDQVYQIKRRQGRPPTLM